jgi:predicted MPP superfamily phosphohydrolase
MKIRIMLFIVFSIVFVLIDFYVFQAVLTVSKNYTPFWKAFFRYGFWIPTLLSLFALLWWAVADPYKYGASLRSWMITGLSAFYISKVFGIAILFIDDLQRGVKWLTSFWHKGASDLPGQGIPRSEFLAKTALVAASVPFGAMAYGIISGAHDYRLKRVTVTLKNLPKSFDGLTIGHLSDIHSGSFFNKTAVKGGVEIMMKQKPDLIFFTGDLVNNSADEVKDFIAIFDKLKAPLGVYAVTGNHDYGDYHRWSSMAAKQRNFKDLIEAHKLMGYTLLQNDHRYIEQAGEKIAILGIENWGAGRFSKYGKMEQAYAGTQEGAVKLLLSHDPSHWDAQVRPHYPDIDVAFAGHTHGFQFGVEIGGFKWSPSQYIYKQWAGLYKEGEQHLYVNRGFGYLGYPGRVGMPPELTIMQLKRG